jgi:hypothetical protein
MTLNPASFVCGSEIEWAADTAMAIKVMAADPDLDATTLSVSYYDVTVDPVTGAKTTTPRTDLPSGATFAADASAPPDSPVSNFAWTPGELDGGLYRIEFTADDGNGGTATCWFDVKVLGDKDGDGLPDKWEQEGYTWTWTDDNNVSHTATVPLHTMGAHWLRKDLFVQICYMNDGAGNDHTPLASTISDITKAFEDAPVDNPAGAPAGWESGIKLHILAERKVAYQANLAASSDSATIWNAVDALKATPTLDTTDPATAVNYPPEYHPAVHFAVFCHLMSPGDGRTGLSRNEDLTTMEVGAHDFILSLGALIEHPDIGAYTPEDQAGTFMHELGHNLGLMHGGHTMDESQNYKPNYLSVMNYAFQRSGLVQPIKDDDGNVTGTKIVYDFSRDVLPSLNESALNESVGLSNWKKTDPVTGDVIYDYLGHGTVWFNEWLSVTDMKQVATGGDSPLHWDGDSGTTLTSYASSINNDADKVELTGWDDWAHITFGADGTKGAGVEIPLPVNTPAEEYSVDDVVVVAAPSPENLTAIGTPHRIHLFWDKVKPPQDYTYKVYRQEPGQLPLLLVATDNHVFHDDTAVAGVTYIYTVRTVDRANEQSAPSNAVEAQLKEPGGKK